MGRLKNTSQGVSSRLLVEVSFDQTLAALQKSELLRSCAEHNPRPLQVARLLRLWAENRGVVGQRQGYLSGYALCLLAIFYCQCCKVLGALSPKTSGELSAFHDQPKTSGSGR